MDRPFLTCNTAVWRRMFCWRSHFAGKSIGIYGLSWRVDLYCNEDFGGYWNEMGMRNPATVVEVVVTYSKLWPENLVW